MLPLLEERQTLATGADVILGLPIRGFGTMLLVAVTAGMAVAVWQARREGFDPEVIYSAGFWMFLWAVVGARLFYVVQKWDQFVSENWQVTLGKVLNFTEGGLVVYGALVGGMAAGLVYTYRHRLPTLALADLIAPSLVLGLSIGRIGCLMNGCCYGGISDLPWSITFPQKASRRGHGESPPYDYQHRTGLLHGMQLDADAQNRLVVRRLLADDGPAARAGLRPGDRIQAINGRQVHTLEEAMAVLSQAGPQLTVVADQGRTIGWSVGALPPRCLPVHPTQIYSAINAAVIFLFVFAYYPFRRRDGEVFALLLTIYPITRFLLEIIRTDEGAIFGTGMTISQNVSILVLAAMLALWLHVLRSPGVGRALPDRPTTRPPHPP